VLPLVALGQLVVAPVADEVEPRDGLAVVRGERLGGVVEAVRVRVQGGVPEGALAGLVGQEEVEGEVEVGDGVVVFLRTVSD
jgi:hypothetical protein